MTPLRAIRKHCEACGSDEPTDLEACPIRSCALYPFRFGTNPYKERVKEPLSEAELDDLDKRVEAQKRLRRKRK